MNSPHNRLKGIPSSHLQPSYPTHLFSLKQSQCCFLSLKSKDDKVRNCKLTKQHDTLFYIAATPRLGALNRKRQRFHPLEKGNIALYPIVFGFAKRLGMARSHRTKKKKKSVLNRMMNACLESREQTEYYEIKRQFSFPEESSHFVL